MKKLTQICYCVNVSAVETCRYVTLYVSITREKAQRNDELSSVMYRENAREHECTHKTAINLNSSNK